MSTGVIGLPLKELGSEESGAVDGQRAEPQRLIQRVLKLNLNRHRVVQTSFTQNLEQTSHAVFITIIS